MNPLRLVATTGALIIGLGGCAIALANLPWGALSGRQPAPGYVWMNMLGGVVLPLVMAVAIATGLLLLARIDRRLDQLQTREGADHGR